MAKIQFWQENEGENSSGRLVFLTGNAYALGMGAWVFATTHDYVALITTVPALAAVFGLQKFLQKQEETKQLDKIDSTKI